MLGQTRCPLAWEWRQGRARPPGPASGWEKPVPQASPVGATPHIRVEVVGRGGQHQGPEHPPVAGRTPGCRRRHRIVGSLRPHCRAGSARSMPRARPRAQGGLRHRPARSPRARRRRLGGHQGSVQRAAPRRTARAAAWSMGVRSCPPRRRTRRVQPGRLRRRRTWMMHRRPLGQVGTKVALCHHSYRSSRTDRSAMPPPTAATFGHRMGRTPMLGDDRTHLATPESTLCARKGPGRGSVSAACHAG